MKKILCLVTSTALLCGCGQKPSHWDYKVVTVENHAHKAAIDAMIGPSTNALDQWRAAKRDDGDFYDLDIDELGHKGWELVSALPQTETVPDADFDDTPVYNPTTQQMDPNRVRFSNIRTGKIVLIFKRPE
jgi:hypothetical protein